jgi:hypothetical protein
MRFTEIVVEVLLCTLHIAYVICWHFHRVKITFRVAPGIGSSVSGLRFIGGHFYFKHSTLVLGKVKCLWGVSQTIPSSEYALSLSLFCFVEQPDFKLVVQCGACPCLV